GFQVGMSIPLWRKAGKANVRSAETNELIVQQQAQNEKIRLEETQKQLLAQLNSLSQTLTFYEQEGKQLAEQIITTSGRAFQAGEIDFLQYILSLENARNMNRNYLDNLIQYNWTILDINYLTN
ncbi:MAG: TolC family protein, partial [Bacteroidia bacterium]